MATMFATRCSAPISWTRFLLLAVLCSLLIGSSLARPASDDDDDDNGDNDASSGGNDDASSGSNDDASSGGNDDANSGGDYNEEPAPTTVAPRPNFKHHHHHAHVHPKRRPTFRNIPPRGWRRRHGGRGRGRGRSRASEIEPNSTTKEPMSEAISSPPPSVDGTSAEPESRAGQIGSLVGKIDPNTPVQKLLVPLGSNDDDAKDSNDDYNDYDYVEPAPKPSNSSQVKPTSRGSDVDNNASTTTAVLISTTEAPATTSDPTTTGQPK